MKKKNIRNKGKVSFSEYFKELKEGDSVAVKKELSVTSSFPERLQGRTGIVESKRGKAYIIRLNDLNKEKRYLIEPIHLKKLKTA